MTGLQITGLTSAILGAIGTIILFIGSYALQPLQGGFFGSDAIDNSNNQIKVKNVRRLLLQRTGLVFLCLSFSAQAISTFFTP